MMQFKDKKFLLIFVPAAAVKQIELTIFVITEFKKYVDGFFLNFIKF